MFTSSDLSGQARGKGFPTSPIAKGRKSGIGWTPTNLSFTASGTIGPSIWGSHCDVMFIAEHDTRGEVDYDDGTPAERFYPCDVQNTDGTPGNCCPRNLLRATAAALLAKTGLVLKATFEHEFIYSGANSRTGDNCALDAIRRHGAFGEAYLGALKTAGVEVDSYLAEFAAGQFEVTAPPADALKACDTAVIVRELARATAFRLGHSVSFSPRVTPDSIGSGVHIRFSLWDQNGQPVSHDPARPFGIGAVAGQFLSGIVRHMPALCACTAPSTASYVWVVSHAWTGVWSNVGLRDREARLRICPTFGTNSEVVARQFSFEYRVADTTANPYLQLAVILRAGLAGIRASLDAPQPTSEEEPETMTPEARAARHIVRLPTSADAALAALQADPVVQGFPPDRLLKASIANKQAEIALSRDWRGAEICKRYAEVY